MLFKNTQLLRVRGTLLTSDHRWCSTRERSVSRKFDRETIEPAIRTLAWKTWYKSVLYDKISLKSRTSVVKILEQYHATRFRKLAGRLLEQALENEVNGSEERRIYAILEKKVSKYGDHIYHVHGWVSTNRRDRNRANESSLMLLVTICKSVKVSTDRDLWNPAFQLKQRPEFR